MRSNSYSCLQKKNKNKTLSLKELYNHTNKSNSFETQTDKPLLPDLSIAKTFLQTKFSFCKQVILIERLILQCTNKHLLTLDILIIILNKHSIGNITFTKCTFISWYMKKLLSEKKSFFSMNSTLWSMHNESRNS